MKSAAIFMSPFLIASICGMYIMLWYRENLNRPRAGKESQGGTMHKKYAFFSGLYHSPIVCLAAVMLVALAWGSRAFCGEIHDAAKRGDVETVRKLLKGDPNLVFSQDVSSGATPLHYAAQEGHKDVAELLLANHADVNAKTFNGATPLHLAAQRGHKDVVELLLANHARVNAKALNGATPLHVAAAFGQKDVVEVLLANHAEVNVTANEGDTPLRVAEQEGHEDVADLLRRHGGHE